jgi:hypothetical protein
MVLGWSARSKVITASDASSPCSLTRLGWLTLGGGCELALEVPLKDLAVLEEVLDGEVVVQTWPLHLLLKVSMVLAGVRPTHLLLAYTVGSSDELNVVALAILLVLPTLHLVGLIPALGFGLASVPA